MFQVFFGRLLLVGRCPYSISNEKSWKMIFLKSRLDPYYITFSSSIMLGGGGITCNCFMPNWYHTEISHTGLSSSDKKATQPSSRAEISCKIMKFHVNLKSTKSESDFKAGFSATALSHLIKKIGPSFIKPSQNWSKQKLFRSFKCIIGKSGKTHPIFSKISNFRVIFG